MTNFGGLNNCIINDKNQKLCSLPLGIAHFLEHSMFDPKEQRDLDQIYGEIGVHVNAYTSYYQQGIIGSANKNNIYNAIGLLTKFLNIKHFDSKIIELNKQIIYDEMLRSQTKYEQVGYDLALSNVYPELELSNTILGTRESLLEINSNLLEYIYRLQYSYDKLKLLIVGDIHLGRLEEIISSYFSELSYLVNYKTSICLPYFEKANIIRQSSYKLDIRYTHLTIVYRDAYSKDSEVLEQVIVQIILDIIFSQNTKKELSKYILKNNYVYYSTHLKYFVVQLYTTASKIDVSKLLHNLLKDFSINQTVLDQMKNRLLGKLFIMSDDLSILSGELRQFLPIHASLNDKYYIILSLTVDQVLNKYYQILSHFDEYSTCVILEK